VGPDGVGGRGRVPAPRGAPRGSAPRRPPPVRPLSSRACDSVARRPLVSFTPIGRRHLMVGGVLIAVLLGAALWLHSIWTWRGISEYRMQGAQDIPTAVAVAPDGTVWFTIDFSDAIGVLKQNRLHRIPKDGQNFEPLGLAVDRDGRAWYTDGPSRRISRMSPDGVVASFALSTPVAKLGRLASAPDGAVWFAEESTYSFTRFKDGAFTRHA